MGPNLASTAGGCNVISPRPLEAGLENSRAPRFSGRSGAGHVKLSNGPFRGPRGAARRGFTGTGGHPALRHGRHEQPRRQRCAGGCSSPSPGGDPQVLRRRRFKGPPPSRSGLYWAGVVAEKWKRRVAEKARTKRDQRGAIKDGVVKGGEMDREAGRGSIRQGVGLQRSASGVTAGACRESQARSLDAGRYLTRKPR